MVCGYIKSEGMQGMSYYEPGEALDRCRAADKHWVAGDYGRFFEEYMNIAVETSYPLAECQVGFCYLEGHGVEKDVEKALYWTNRSALHGDMDAQYNLAWIYENGICGSVDLKKARHWYRQSALQGFDMAVEKCREYGISLEARD